MRPRLRLAISIGSVLWLLGLAALITWHQIWAPVFAAKPRADAVTRNSLSRLYGNPVASFSDTFRGEKAFDRRQVDVRHPQHGSFATDVQMPGSGRVLLSAGAVMANNTPVQDGVVALTFSHPQGADPGAGVFVAVFGRVQEDTEPRGLHPYQTGYAFEWDMHDGRQRLWCGEKMLAERPAPGDSAPHTLALVMQGSMLQGQVDGARVLEAQDSRYLTGSIGFGGHGRPALVVTRFALQRPGEGGSALAAAVDVGAPFAVTDTFAPAGAPPTTRRNRMSFSYGSSGERMLFSPQYVLAGESGGRMRRELNGAVQFVMSNCTFALIDSKHARESTITAASGSVRRSRHETGWIAFDADHALRSTLFVRAQSADEPWAGCYGLSYDRLEDAVRMWRSDATGPARRNHWPPTRPTVRATLGAMKPPADQDPLVLVLTAQGAVIRGGVQGLPLMAATDARYAEGYVGFGAGDEETAVFDWASMRGR